MRAAEPAAPADQRTDQAADGRARRPPRLRWLLLAAGAAAVWVVYRTGPGLVPYVTRFEEIARDWPTSTVQPYEGYVLRAALGQAVYSGLWPHSVQAFLLLHGLALVLSAVLLTAWLLQRYGRETGSISALVLLLSPLPAVLILWIGLYDAFSVLAWVLLVVSLTARRGWQVAAALVAGAQNFEQVLIGVVLLALLPELGRAARWRVWAPGLLLGTVAGKVLLEVYLRAVDAPSGSRLSFLLDDPTMLRNALLTFALTAPLVVISALGALWVFAVPALLRGWPVWTPSLRRRLALATAIWVGGGILALDHTRALVLTAFPLVVAGVVAVARSQESWSAFWRRPEIWVLLLYPPLVVWDKITLDVGVRLGATGIGPF